MDHDHYIDLICQQGCDSVREVISTLEQGRDVDYLPRLEGEERQQLLVELKAVMAVYDQQ